MPGSTNAVAVPSTLPFRLPSANMPAQPTISPARQLPAFEDERLESFQPQHPFNMHQSSPPSPHRSALSSNRPRAVSAASVTNIPDYRVWSQGLNIIENNHASNQLLEPRRSPPLSPTPDLDDAASVFSFGAYCRDDNACTPRINDHAPPDDIVISIPSTPRLEQLDSEATPSLPMHLSKSITITPLGMMVFPDSPSSTRRSRRPAPLNLEQVHRSPTTSAIVQGRFDEAGNAMCPQGSCRDQEHYRISPRAADVLPRLTPPVVPEVEYVKGIDLQLWIDQEEFRMIQPLFRFKKHSQRQRQQPPNTGVGDRFISNIGELGLVELRMASRDVGTFDVGVSDSAPNLVVFTDLCNRKPPQPPAFEELLSTTMILPIICRRLPCYRSPKMASTQLMAWRSVGGRSLRPDWFGSLNIRSKISVCPRPGTLSLVKRFFITNCLNYHVLILP